MPGNLTPDELSRAIDAGEIDTVVVAFPDAQGRLVNAAGFYLLGTTNMAAGLTPDDLQALQQK